MQAAKTVEQLAVPLTPEEVLMKGKQLTQRCIEVAKLEAEKKLQASAIKSDIDAVKEKIKDLVVEIDRGEEIRPIECYERPRYGAQMVDIIRTDTGAVVRQRAMHPNERQAAFDMGEELPPPKQERKRGKKPTDEAEGAH